MLCLQLILKQVKTFVTGSTYGRKICINELVQSAVFLLEHLPSARQAVLQYLSSVFHDAVNNEFVSKDTSGTYASKLGINVKLIICQIKSCSPSFPLLYNERAPCFFLSPKYAKIVTSYIAIP